MDAIDLGANNVPLSWYPRVLWYETQLVHDFARCYEKCKGPKAKGAYLNRKVKHYHMFSVESKL